MIISRVQNPGKRIVLMVSSSGGHWVQLMRLVPAFDGFDKVFVTTNQGYRIMVSESKFHSVTNASKWNKFKVLILALQVLQIVIKVKPNVVVSTGAAPGFFALLFGKWIGAKTIWLDSIANAEKMSLSGRMARTSADLWLTQWEHLAQSDGPQYYGAIL